LVLPALPLSARLALSAMKRSGRRANGPTPEQQQSGKSGSVTEEVELAVAVAVVSPMATNSLQSGGPSELDL
jgi:hypothetical protein